MANIITFTDPTLPALRVYNGMTDPQLRSRAHPEEALFLAENHLVISTALDAGYEPVSMLMTQRQINGTSGKLIERCPEVPVYTADDSILEQLTGFRMTRSCLCALRRKPAQDPIQLIKNATRIAVFENLSEAANIGGLFRSAAALGVDAVIASPSCCDLLHRRVVRFSMGTVFLVPWAVAPADIPLTDFLHNQGFRTVAMALTDNSRSLEDPEIRAEERLAIILGAEGPGLKPETIAGCDYTVKIPMAHGVDSLNVAAAGAIAFYTLCARDRT